VDIGELRRLRELAGASLIEVEKEAPELFAEIQLIRVEVVRRALSETLASEAPHVRESLERIDIQSALESGNDLTEVVREALREPGAPEAAGGIGELLTRVDELERAGVLVDPLDPALPVREQPVLKGLLLQAEVVAIADLAGLATQKAAGVLEHVPSPAMLDAGGLEGLVESGTVTVDEAGSLGLAASLYNLLDADTALVAAVKSRVSDIRELAELPVDAWRPILVENAITPPVGTSLDAHVAQLARRVAAVLPTDALFARLAPRDADALVTKLERMDARQLGAVANAYPGLKVSALVEELDGSERAQRIAERIGFVGRIRDLNPDVELLELDLAPDSRDVESLRFDGIPETARDGVLTALRAYQRVHRLTDDPDTSRALLAAGFVGSADIVERGREGFVAASGLGEATARRVFANAEASFAAVTAAFGSVLEATLDGGQWAAVANLAPGTGGFLRGVSGYAELFETQAACRCEHCQSILSPSYTQKLWMGLRTKAAYLPG
jgi:hypothetical protein